MNHRSHDLFFNRRFLLNYAGFVIPIIAIVSGVALGYKSTKTPYETSAEPALRGGINDQTPQAANGGAKCRRNTSKSGDAVNDESEGRMMAATENNVKPRDTVGDQSQDETAKQRCQKANPSHAGLYLSDSHGANEVKVVKDPCPTAPVSNQTEIPITLEENHQEATEEDPLSGATDGPKYVNQARNAPMNELGREEQARIGTVIEWLRSSSTNIKQNCTRVFSCSKPLAFVIFFLVAALITCIVVAQRDFNASSILTEDNVIRPGFTPLNPYAESLPEEFPQCHQYVANAYYRANLASLAKEIFFDSLEEVIANFEPPGGPMSASTRKAFRHFMFTRVMCGHFALDVFKEDYERFSRLYWPDLHI